jgi:hypothetical protein
VKSAEGGDGLTDISHSDIAAYVLGLLDDRDNEAFEEHLFDCQRCQLELVDLQIVPDTLDQIRAAQQGAKPVAPAPRKPMALAPRRPPVPAQKTPVDARPPASSLQALLARTVQARKRNRRVAILAAAAAVGLIVTGPVVTAAVITGQADEPNVNSAAANPGARSSTSTSSEPGLVRTGGAPERRDILGPGSTAPPTGDVRATVILRDRDWGTSVDLELYGITGPLRCQLVAVSLGGEQLPVTGWTVPEKGYGVPGFPEPLRVTGGVGIPRDNLERLDVVSDRGIVIVSIYY